MLCFTGSAQASQIAYAFSPEDHSALDLVINEISGAQKSINLMGYAFTSPQISKALAAAQDRGVTVRLVLDHKSNQNKTSQRAIQYLQSHKVSIRFNSDYPIMHDKVMIVDDKDVETGSFNYTSSASYKNSENVVIIKDYPDLANVYFKHWKSRYDNGKDVQSDDF
ncbi:TPA: phospholipase D family protein [Yersinia enterocolitica]|nr:phospholipase D family protein [Yersinia enterocolitica]